MFKVTKDGVILNLKILPNSSKNEILIYPEGLKIKITAQPVDGKANKALIEFLSKQFKVAKSNFEIIKGLTSKEKTVFIKNLTSEKIDCIKEILKK